MQPGVNVQYSTINLQSSINNLGRDEIILVAGGYSVQECDATADAIINQCLAHKKEFTQLR